MTLETAVLLSCCSAFSAASAAAFSAASLAAASAFALAVCIACTSSIVVAEYLPRSNGSILAVPVIVKFWASACISSQTVVSVDCSGAWIGSNGATGTPQKICYTNRCIPGVLKKFTRFPKIDR